MTVKEADAQAGGAELDNAMTAQAREAAAYAALPVSANASSKRLIKNVIVGYVTTLITTLISFFTTPLLIHFLGAGKFGLWTMLLSLLGYVGMVEVGTYTTVAKRVAECLAVNDRERLQKLLSTAAAMYLVMSAVALAAVASLSVLLPRLYPRLSISDQHLAQMALLLLGAFQCVTFLFAPQSAILFGAGRNDLLNRTSTLINTTQAIVNVGLVMRGYGILALCLSAIGGGAVSGVLMRRLARQNVFAVRISLSHASWETARDLLKYGSRFSLMSIAGAIGFSSDVLILGFLLPSAAIAQYAIASKMVGIVGMLAGKPVSNVIPAFAHMETEGNRVGQFRLMTNTAVAGTLISLPFVLSFCVFGDRLIQAWVGNGFQQSYPVLVTLALWSLAVLPAGPCVNLMLATDKNLFLTRAYLVAAAGNLMLSVVLTKHFGITGPALGSLIMVFFLEVLILPAVTCRLFDFSLKAFWLSVLRPIVLPALAALASALLLKNLPSNRLLTLIMMLIVPTVCWATWYRFVLDRETRGNYFRGLRKRLPF